MATKTTKTTKTAKPAAKLPAPQVLKPGKDGPTVVPLEEAKLRELTIAYVQGDQKAGADAAQVAGAVAAHYKSRAAFEEAQKDYQTRFILPGLNKKHRDAYAVAIPHGRTEEGKDAKWKEPRKAFNTVGKILSQYFKRIKNRAFPVKAEPTPTTLRTWNEEKLVLMLKKNEKAEDGDPAFIKMLRKLQEINRLGDDEGDE
jgi:hypothetical protein